MGNYCNLPIRKKLLASRGKSLDHLLMSLNVVNRCGWNSEAVEGRVKGGNSEEGKGRKDSDENHR